MSDSAASPRRPSQLSPASPFKRAVGILIPVSAQASTVALPAGFFKVGGRADGSGSFVFVNSFPFYVRLRGTTDGDTPNLAADVLGQQGGALIDDWLLLPHSHIGPITTQRPKWMSAIAVARPGYPLPTNPAMYQQGSFEVHYGSGS